MPRDYYIKINLFKYPSVMNQPLNHLIDKSVSQLKICDYNSVANANNKWSSTTSDFIWCTDYDSLYLFNYPWLR